MRNRKYFELNNKNIVFKILFVTKRKLIALKDYNRKERPKDNCYIHTS